jgi:hypothetical protein
LRKATDCLGSIPDACAPAEIKAELRWVLAALIPILRYFAVWPVLNVMKALDRTIAYGNQTNL